jgi:hypothetical protein
MRTPRTAHLHIKLTPEERERLRELERADGLEASGVMRQLLNRAHQARFVGQPAMIAVSGRPIA